MKRNALRWRLVVKNVEHTLDTESLNFIVTICPVLVTEAGNDVGCLGMWVLRLAPFKFQVKQTHGTDNVVADALSYMFEGTPAVPSDVFCLAPLQSLPLIYLSLGDHRSWIPSVWTSERVLRRDRERWTTLKFSAIF
jgi:hypothetical protein